MRAVALSNARNIEGGIKLMFKNYMQSLRCILSGIEPNVLVVDLNNSKQEDFDCSSADCAL